MKKRTFYIERKGGEGWGKLAKSENMEQVVQLGWASAHGGPRR